MSLNPQFKYGCADDVRKSFSCHHVILDFQTDIPHNNNPTFIQLVIDYANSAQETTQKRKGAMENSSELKKKNTLRIIFTVITILVMVFIFVQSAMPDEQSAKESDLIVEIITDIMNKTHIEVTNLELISYLVRKVAHFTEYTVFGLSLGLTANAYFGTKWWISLSSWGFGVLYAATDEYHQTFVPGRYGSVKDVIIDSMGLALGVVITYFIFHKKSKETKTKNGTYNFD